MLAVIYYTSYIVNIFKINIIEFVIVTLYKILNLIFFDMLVTKFQTKFRTNWEIEKISRVDRVLIRSTKIYFIIYKKYF